MLYKIVKIKKTKKKYRTIYIPNLEFKLILKSYLPFLNSVLDENDEVKVNHAFLKNRNCVTNALKHVGYKYCLSIDLEDFFESIKKEHLSNYLNKSILDLLLIDNSLKQGFPTSPVLSNIAFIKTDREINKFILSLNDVVYTRYADDLYFSFNDIQQKLFIFRKVNQILIKNKFKINEYKTKFQKLNNGNITITGVSVTKNGVKPTRKIIKKIRAAKHQKNKRSLNGLLEWSYCNLPKNLDITELY